MDGEAVIDRQNGALKFWTAEFFTRNIRTFRMLGTKALNAEKR